MKILEELIYEDFSMQKVCNDLDYTMLHEDVFNAEQDLLEKLTSAQIELLNIYQQTTGCFKIYNEERLVNFIFNFIRNIFVNQIKRINTI